jgi:hypothetical protein
MNEFSKVAYVWGGSPDAVLPGSPSVTVNLWPLALDCAVLKWDTASGVPDNARNYDVFLVNMFPHRPHVSELRKAHPSAFIVAMPDPSLEIVLSNPSHTSMIEEMSHADMIGGRTPYDCNVYGALLNKPTFWLPSPIGRTEDFLPYRDTPKEDYILSLDHPLDPYMAGQNVAALAAIQRETGMRVVYAWTRPTTPVLAQFAGLQAEFLPRVEWHDFLNLTAKARLCVDMYARHTYGRHAALCAMVGTPCITSSWVSVTGHTQIHPFNTEYVRRATVRLLSSGMYARARRSGFEKVEFYGFDASRERAQLLLKRINGVKAHA